MKTKRDRAFMAGCPRCGVGPGVRCVAADGTKRRSVHKQRMTAPADASYVAYATPGGFYQSDEWRRLRYQALILANGCCQACGNRAAPGRSLHVDHIKPRSKFPEFALSLSNLQVLCEDCNIGKGASDQTDWRREP